MSHQNKTHTAYIINLQSGLLLDAGRGDDLLIESRDNRLSLCHEPLINNTAAGCASCCYA